MQYVAIGHINMSINEEIKNILFQIGQDIKIHRIDQINMIIEIDYDKYIQQIIELFDRQTE
jgi:hypothetical protein